MQLPTEKAHEFHKTMNAGEILDNGESKTSSQTTSGKKGTCKSHFKRDRGLAAAACTSRTPASPKRFSRPLLLSLVNSHETPPRTGATAAAAPLPSICRIDPRVQLRIESLVQAGITNAIKVRKDLRLFFSVK